MSEKLKPCPFCGGEAVIAHPKNADLFTYDKYYVQCSKCKATASTIIVWENRTERTVKIKHHRPTEVWSVCECGQGVNLGWNYCPFCGGRITWKR